MTLNTAVLHISASEEYFEGGPQQVLRITLALTISQRPPVSGEWIEIRIDPQRARAKDDVAAKAEEVRS